MELTCPRGPLTTAVQTAATVIPARTPREILRNLKLQAHGDEVTVMATDLEVAIRSRVTGVTCPYPVETLLPASRLVQILKEVGGDSITLEIGGDGVVLRAGGSEFRLPTEDAADFPPVPDFTDSAYHVLSGPALRTLIRRTLFATDLESTRYALGGVLVELTPERANFVATDGRRLALASALCRVEGALDGGNTQPVVPSKAMSLIERSLEGAEEVKLAIHANDVMVQAGRSTIFAQLTQGRFPDYRKVIPKTSNALIDLNVGPFYSAVRQSQIVTNEESRGIEFTFSEGVLHLSGEAADIGEANIELPISYAGPSIRTKYDPRFVADFLKVLDPERTITFRLIDGESAAVLTADEEYTYVLMPLNLD